MYSLLISFSVAVLFGFGGVVLDWWHWIWGILITLVVFIVVWIVIARRIAARLQPAMMQVQRQMEAGHVQLAMQTLQDMRAMGKWVPLLEGQLLAQMGMLSYYTGDKQKSIGLLEGSSRRNADAQLLLACIRYKDGEVERALSILQFASKLSKKHALLHNTYAWMLHKQSKSDEAQKVLADFLKKDANNGPTKDNMLRLQNRTRMNMQVFDMQWYALGLEQPPQTMGQMRRAPKGFREPPKGKKGG